MSVTIPQLTEKIIRSVEGSVDPNDGKLDYLYIEANLSKWRQSAINRSINGAKDKGINWFIPPQLYQEFEIDIIRADQNPSWDYVEVEIPAPARMNEIFDGTGFLGDRNTNRSFSQISSPMYASDLVRRGDLNKDTVGFLNIGHKTRFYGDKELKKVYVQRVCVDPTAVPDYDIDITIYPLDEDTEALLILLAAAELNPQVAKVTDVVSDMVSTMERRALKVNGQ